MLLRLSERLDSYFQRLSRNAIVVVALIFSLVIGAVDYYTQPAVLIFYLIPVAFAAWYGGTAGGGVIAIYAAGAGYVSDIVDTNRLVDSTALWSLAWRVLMFLMVARILGKLQESRSQQKDMMNFIVHDLRSPISSAITGLMTLEQTSEHLDDLDREMVSLALVSNQRAVALVNSMLDLAKLENGKMEIRHECVVVDQLLADACEQVSLWAMGRHITFKRETQVERASLDPTLTVRVLVNLLSNALKYSPDGSEIEIKVIPAGKDGMRFTVRDHGPGMPAEYVGRIFEPFSQVKGTKGGTGLGLTFCRLAVTAQGGKIWVESQLGKGTQMHFTIPHIAPKQPESAASPEGIAKEC